jgi:23S rRNA (pseudouridine1915-N3)-methyltransferase
VLKLTLAAVGRLRPEVRAVADEYAARVARFMDFSEVEVREASRAPSPAVQRREEAARLREKILEGSRIVVLDRAGKGLASDALARELDRWRTAARPVCLILGGSHGLAEDLVQSADLAWSLGPLTLPHELARVVVLEQVYRAWTILRGEPYHK